MDDLDHSMHISEYDWTSFYEESEECGLLQPLLACPDSSSLSDSEDSGNSSSVFSVGYISGQISCSGTGGGQLDHSTAVHITTTLQTELNVHSSDGESTELEKEDAEMQMESDSSELTSTQEADPLPCNRTELNANELHASDRAESEDVRGVAVRAEKERWFVTVNDSPARHKVPSTSVKKKRRQKKTRKGDHMFKRSPERSLGNSLKLEIMRDNNESEGEMDAENSTQVNQNFGKEAIGSAEKAPESIQMGGISDSSGRSLMPKNKEELSEKLEMSNSPKDDSDPVTDTSSYCVLTPKEPSPLDSVESDELEDAVEFLSTHSFDSESYLSATESVEELLHLLMENQQLQSSLSVTESSSNNETAANFEGHGNTDVQPTLTFPSAAQSANKMPDDNSTCDNDTRGVLSADTRGFQRHEANLSASACSSGVQLPPIPDLTVTPCSVADSPETYAKAEGHLRPVYAISAFWDEMEKLTINDILQLRMGRRETQHTATPDVDGHSCSMVDTLECNSSDGRLMDTSDTADSDYFTQPDESKPDRSSCEFSTSEFEEEYWQFLGTSRNSSPNPQSEIQLSTSDFSSLAHEDEESTSSEGKETPVPSEDFMRKCFEDHNSNDLSSSKLVWPRKMTKSKSVHNVQALNTEDLSLELLLGNDEGRLILSSCPPLEDNMVLKANDSLATLTSAPFPDELSFPEKSEYFFREEKAGSDSQWVTVYEPQQLSVFDYPLCTFRDEMSFFSLNDFQHRGEKPIPIFSCSHPTVRELTFPNPDYIFLDANCEEGDAISPIRVVSCSFIQGGGFHSWKSLMRMIRFPVKGSLWCRRSGAWTFPVEAERILVKSSDLPMQTEARVSLHPSQLFGELVVQQRVLEATQTTRREGIFSTLRQSDMCLVCIAFASWVLKSSDPEAADAWKAALLANVSALSAIQYLRQYVRRKKPS